MSLNCLPYKHRHLEVEDLKAQDKILNDDEVDVLTTKEFDKIMQGLR